MGKLETLPNGQRIYVTDVWFAVERDGRYVTSPKLAPHIGAWSPSLRFGRWFKDERDARAIAGRVGGRVVSVRLDERPT